MVAGLAEKKRIDKIWETAARLMPERQTTTQPASASAASARDAATRVYGNVLADERFGGQRVTVFANGYVQFSSGPYERLLRIEEGFVIQKKTAPGRLAAGVVTMGTNFAFTGNKRGDLYLSLVTDSRTQTLSESPPTDSGVRRGTALALAGRAAIDQSHRDAGAAAAAPAPAAQHREAPELRLAKLDELRGRGLISPEEYATTRANILSDL